MPIEDVGTDIGELAEGEDLDFLKLVAAERGVPVERLAKHGIQKIFAQRTRPRSMSGTIQAFRRKP